MFSQLAAVARVIVSAVQTVVHVVIVIIILSKCISEFSQRGAVSKLHTAVELQLGHCVPVQAALAALSGDRVSIPDEAAPTLAALSG